MDLLPLLPQEVERRDAIDAAFTPVAPESPQGDAEITALTVKVRQPYVNVARLDLVIDGDELVENHTVQRETSRELGTIDVPAGEHELEVRWMTPGAFSFVAVGCTLTEDAQELVIDAGDPAYPPRLLKPVQIPDIDVGRSTARAYTHGRSGRATSAARSRSLNRRGLT